MKATVWEDSSLSLLQGVLYGEKTDFLRDHVMAFHRVAESGQRRRTADVESSCECIKYAVTDSRQGVALRIANFQQGLPNLHVKIMLGDAHRTSELVASDEVAAR